LRRVGRTRLTVAAGLAISLATLTLASFTAARAPDRPAALDSAAFELIAGGDQEVAALVATPAPSRTAPPAIADFPVEDASFPPRPEPAIDINPTIVNLATPTPRPTRQPVAVVGGNHRVSGTATWYCKTGVSACHYQYPGGMYAAAGPGIRIGNWRGRTVRVCGNGRCVTVKLIDWCACPGSRIIDLYSDAFQRLAPLSSGTVKVTVSW
jgi:hypothetical protein